MDIGTHLLTGMIIGEAIKDPFFTTMTLVGSVIPDISLVFIYIKFLSNHPFTFSSLSLHLEKPPPFILWIYHLLHSFTFLLILLLFAFLFKNIYFWGFFWGYLSHILWDIPTHKGVFSFRPFFPFSSFSIKGISNWWLIKKQWFYIFILWGILLLVWGLLHFSY